MNPADRGPLVPLITIMAGAILIACAIWASLSLQSWLMAGIAGGRRSGAMAPGSGRKTVFPNTDRSRRVGFRDICVPAQ